MCIAIYKPHGKEIDDYTLESCYFNNPDGIGYMFANNNQLHIRKGYFDFDTFLKDFRQDEELNPYSPFAIHFRIATSGLIDADNCHPHLIGRSLALAHNGIIRAFSYSKVKSDTMILCEKLAKMKNWFYSKNQRSVVEAIFTESWSKGIFMNHKGMVWIANRSAGHNVHGLWFSNDGYKEDKIMGYKYNGIVKTSNSTDYYTKCITPQYKDMKQDKEHPEFCGYCGYAIGTEYFYDEEDIPVCMNCHSYMYPKLYGGV